MRIPIFINLRQNFWHSWFVEPTIWLLRCFFQPASFQRDVERETIAGRLRLTLRLMIPLFLFIYPLALFLRIVVYLYLPATFRPYYPIHTLLSFEPAVLLFAFDCLWATFLSCLLGGVFGSLLSVVYGVAAALALALASGIAINNQNDALVGVIFGLSFGSFLSLTFNNIEAIRRSGLGRMTLGAGVGTLTGIGVGLLTGTFGGYWSGLLVGLIGGPEVQRSSTNITGSIAGLVVGGLTAALLVRLVGAIVQSSVNSHTEVIEASTRIGVVVAGAFGLSVGSSVGDVGLMQANLWTGISAGWINTLIVGLAFLVSYIPNYYRLLLYPFNAASMLKVYLDSQKHPERIFYNLRHCALFWDECVFLPLPYVRPLLLIAANQNVELALREIDFLLHERPQQRIAVLATALEIALGDLCLCEGLRDISHAHQRLQVTLPHEVRLFNPQAARLFRHIEDASRDAASYYSRINRQARYEALENMLTDLQGIYSTTVFREARLNRRLEQLMQRWRIVAKHEQENVSRDNEDFGSITNPYVPGLVLELRDPLFVGRKDVAQQLGEALLRPRRPTFFLSGERRMGKSSILKQLPDLLGSQYLPVFYDLQSTGIASSTAALLAAIAEGIYDLLMARGMLLKKLEYEQLREDQRQNEAVAYHRFGRWLKDIEQLLEKEGRVLLLTFDEFEKLEEAGHKGHIDLVLLLDWLRSTIQNRPRIALLFSGVKSVGEMGANWSGYFVNVETLKVSFLQPGEARHLITHPVANFPGELIFSEQIVASIIRETGGHPFLIQAVCSIIVTRLNTAMREQAEEADITNAVEEMFQKWEDNYFRDLWERTDEEQRACLRSLLVLDTANGAAIQAQSSLADLSMRRALQRLQRRDLVESSGNCYRIAAPIFKVWVQRSI